MSIVEEGPKERAYGRAIVLGILVGTPAVFIAVLLVSLPLGWPEAAGVAAVPAIFGGPLFGGFAMVLATVARWEREEAHPAIERPSDVVEQRAADAAAA